MAPPGAILFYPSRIGHYKAGLRVDRVTGFDALVC